jgi:hypothetical protein
MRVSVHWGLWRLGYWRFWNFLDDTTIHELVIGPVYIIWGEPK